MRIIAVHAYHRIDYEEVWVTLHDDVPQLEEAINRWRQTQDLYPRQSQATMKVGRRRSRVSACEMASALRLPTNMKGPNSL
jgi:hypothetical protein